MNDENEELLQTRAERVEYAFRLLQGNKDNLGNIPGILRQLISLKVWEGYEWQGRFVEFSSFREFIETPLPVGLGTTVPELVAHCKKYPEIADLIDETVLEQAPSYRLSKNTKRKGTPKGTSFQRSLRRLRSMAQEDEKAAEIRNQFLEGDISANQALEALGIRKKRYSIEATPENLAAFANKHFSPEQRKKLINLLS